MSLINNFDDLLEICNLKKEIKLKYELENNFNLVSFENKRIQISFNENLDKEFVKNLSHRLNEWTNERWIISLSKEKGDLSKKEKDKILKKDFIEKYKDKEIYKKVLENFNDAELLSILTKEEKND